MNDLELGFRVHPAEEGGFTADCRLPEGLILTQGDSWEEVEAMVKDAVNCHFTGSTPRHSSRFSDQSARQRF
jgi:predicted RNase H-like HicB family nuclease